MSLSASGIVNVGVIIVRSAVFVVVFAIWGLQVSAATVRVERDGSGDYLAIQDAVDAAASGDTILIGPGRYNEGKIVTTPGWTEFVRVHVTQVELTLIGAGIGETVIGREELWDHDLHGNDKGIEGSQWSGVQRLVVEDISFENMAQGIRAEPTPELIVRDCSFVNLDYSIFSFNGHSVTTENCSFRGPATDQGGRLVLSLQNGYTEIIGCEFVAPAGIAISVQGNNRFTLRECDFSGGIGGLVVGNQALEISNCVFTDQVRFGLALTDNLNSVITDCIMSGQKMALNFAGTVSQTEIRRVYITDVSQVSIGLSAVAQLDIQDCVLAHGPEYTIWQYNYCKGADKAGSLNMTNNDWGTTDADTIASWISTCTYTVDFVPYVGMPVSIEEKSMGSLKSLFR